MVHLKPSHLEAIFLVANEVITVTFDANGGVIPSGQDWQGSGNTATKDVAPDSTYGNMPTPTKTGYTFLGWSTLPNEYQAVEYIDSTGTQYINTGVTATNTMGVYAKLASNDITNDSVYFGSRGSNNDSRFWIANKDRQIYYGWNANTFRSTNINVGEINEIILNYLNDRKEMFNDELIGDIGSTVLNTVGDYSPCYRLSDGVPGLYDTVNDQFYANNGSGSFVVDGSTLVNSDTVVTNSENHTLYALWEEE